MSIYLYSGTPGSGKSLDSTKRIYDALRRGRCVVCNYELRTDLLPHPENFHYHPNAELSPDLLRNYADDWWKTHEFHERGLLFVLDEAQIIHNARLWNDKGGGGRLAWIEFYSQHRKYGYDVILVSQYDRMLDRQMRALIEYEYIHRAVGNIGNLGFVFSLLGGGQLFAAIEMYYPLKERIGWHFLRASKRITRLYDSYGVFAALPDGAAGAGRGDPATRRAVSAPEPQ